jgi:hypothetical protein
LGVFVCLCQEFDVNNYFWETQSFERSLVESGNSNQIQFDENINIDLSFFGIEEEGRK